MRQIALSIPTGSFPAAKGDRVRIGLRQIVGPDTLDALVVDLTPGCGAFDKVVLRYDETVLPAQSALSACNVAGFLKLCPCCSARPCWEVVIPSASVLPATHFLSRLPGDFRLDALKVYSPDPTDQPLAFNVLVEGEALFTQPVLVANGLGTINRVAFASAFSRGLIPAGSLLELQVVDAPGEFYYEEPWRGLVFCLIGNWQP